MSAGFRPIWMTKRRILVTRSPQQTSELAEGLRAAGMEPVLVPTIEIASLESYAELDDALARLHEFHWVIFTSANAVEIFAQRRRAIDGGSALPKIAVIGPATARAVHDAGMDAALVPAQAVAESLAESLRPLAQQGDGSATRFLLVRAAVAREHLPEVLRAAGAEVTVAPAYRTVVPEASVDALREMFGQEGKHPDAVTFTSSSTAANLVELLRSVSLELPEDVLRVSIGPVTSKTMRELGYGPHVEAARADVASLVEAVRDAFEKRG